MPLRLTPAALAATLLAACGSGAIEEPPNDSSPVPVEVEVASKDLPDVPERETFRFQVDPNESVTLAALLKREVEVLAGPGNGSHVTTLPGTTILGTTTVATVVGDPVDGWVEVMLPIRPNGSTGWIPLEAVELYVVEGEIVVDLSERRLTYYRAGEEVLSTDVGIGSWSSPTPTGTFFVTDRVTMADPDSPWGPRALGLSARSDTVTEYNGGDGIVGIHGTNIPGSIGKAASLGCVRLPNDVIIELYAMVPIGTPVVIRS